MADTMRFDLVSPERRVASMEATQVAIPGAAGDFAVGPGHEPVITTLRPGILRVEGEGPPQEFAVTGGFAEIGSASVTVLAERGLAASELTQETFDAFFEEAHGHARTAREGGEHSVADDAVKLLADMEALGTHVGLSTRQPNL